MKRAAYVWVALALAAAGTVAAVVGGRPPVPVAVGVMTAWAVQAASFWLLAAGLSRGEPVARVWIAGIAARFGTGVLVWAIAVLSGSPTRDLMVAYGMALVGFLILEAGWLAMTTTDRTAREAMDRKRL